MPFKFENLEVWKIPLKVTGIEHDVTLKFSDRKLYVLTPQIKRGADSISLNVAEASTGQSNAEFKKFLGYSKRSAIEVVACIYIANPEKEFQRGFYADLLFYR